MGIKDIKTAIGLGSLAGVIALFCCVAPIVLVLLGLSTVSAAIALSYFWYDNFKWVFLSSSALFLIASVTLYLRAKKQCSISGIRKNVNFILAIVIIAILVYLLLFIATTWLGNVARQ